jgi:hypothetical protein
MRQCRFQARSRCDAAVIVSAAEAQVGTSELIKGHGRAARAPGANGPGGRCRKDRQGKAQITSYVCRCGGEQTNNGARRDGRWRLEALEMIGSSGVWENWAWSAAGDEKCFATEARGEQRNLGELNVIRSAGNQTVQKVVFSSFCCCSDPWLWPWFLGLLSNTAAGRLLLAVPPCAAVPLYVRLSASNPALA